MFRILVIVLLFITTCYACDTYSTGSSSTWSQPQFRSNITENQPGAPLTVAITMINRTSCLQKQDISKGLMNGVEVDIWHVNAAGFYSSNTTNTTYLRGAQVTNTTGAVYFQTIYPGYEKNRTVYINVHVAVPMGNIIVQDETQIFFDDAISDSIYAAFPSYSYGTRAIYNNNDTIFSSNMEVSMVGDSIHGYTAYIDLYYPFINTMTTTTSNNTTVSTTMPTNTTTTTTMPTNAPTTTPTGVPTNTPTITPNVTSDLPTNQPNTTTIPTTSVPTLRPNSGMISLISPITIILCSLIMIL